MPTCKVTKYRISYWTKGYNKGKINVLLDTDAGRTLLVENLTPDQGNFFLEMLRGPGDITCDPDSAEGIVYLNWEQA